MAGTEDYEFEMVIESETECARCMMDGNKGDINAFINRHRIDGTTYVFHCVCQRCGSHFPVCKSKAYLEEKVKLKYG